MKTQHILAAMAIFSAISFVSCKNNAKGTSGQDSAKDDVQLQKQEVADSVLTMIDAFEADFVSVSDKGLKISEMFDLTEDEKIVKPDYLLDPSVAGTLVTKTQKINALAYYVLEQGVRMAYDMPVDDVKSAIAKLAAETAYPLDMESVYNDAPVSEKIRKEYELCKEQGDLAMFWQYQCAFIFHTDYIIASNPQLYIPKISEEGLKQFNLRLEYVNNAATALAPYDQEMAALLKEIKEWDLLLDESEWDAAFATESSTASFYLDNKQAIIERRNRMIE